MPLFNQGPSENWLPSSGAGFMRYARGSIASYSLDGVAPCDTALDPVAYPNLNVTSYSFSSPLHTIGFSGATIGVNALVGLKVLVAKGNPAGAYATIVSNTANTIIAYDDQPQTWALTTANALSVFPYKQSVENTGLLRITPYGELTAGTLAIGDGVGAATLFVWDQERRKFSVVGPATGAPLQHGVQFEITTPQAGVYALQITGVSLVPSLSKIEIRTELAKQYYRS